jgi:bloom syndrome protein
VQIILREDALLKIRQTLVDVFIKDKGGTKLWEWTGVRTPWDDERWLSSPALPSIKLTKQNDRTKLLSPVAREIEFSSVFLLSATDKGYRMRLGWCISALKALAGEGTWEANDSETGQEGAKSLLATFRKVVKGR